MRITKKSTITAWLFLLPFLALFTLFVIYPVIQGVWVSLNKWTLMGRQKFIGLDNYSQMLKDKNFRSALWHTCMFVLMAVPAIVIASMILGLLANRPVRGRKFFRVAYFMPSILSVSVASFLTSYTFAPYRGLVNGILRSLGIMNVKDEILWFASPKLAWFVVVTMTVWWTLGFSMMLFISALQDISPEILEAASVDGAGRFQLLTHVTLPMISHTTFLVIMLQIIACFKVFGQIYIITRGGPANSTRPLIQYIYQMAFDKNKMGYSAAMSYVLFLILVVSTLIQLRIQKRGED